MKTNALDFLTDELLTLRNISNSYREELSQKVFGKPMSELTQSEKIDIEDLNAD